MMDRTVGSSFRKVFLCEFLRRRRIMYADIGIMLILIGVAFAGIDCITAHDVTAFETKQLCLGKITFEVSR